MLEEALTEYEEVVEQVGQAVQVYCTQNRLLLLQAVDNGINIVSQDYSINWDYSQAGQGGYS